MNKSLLAIFILTATIPLLVLAPVNDGPVLASHQTTDKLLKKIIAEQKLQITLQQDNVALLLNATHNQTAQLQISNIYLQNAMVEQHNLGAHILQEMQKK